MNYSEKYFEDEDELNQFAYDLTNYMFENLGYYEGDSINLAKTIKNFLQQPVKPTLTEDEKVILKNIKSFTTIIRNIEGNIQVENNDGSFACLCAFDHLFQFIKVR